MPQMEAFAAKRRRRSAVRRGRRPAGRADRQDRAVRRPRLRAHLGVSRRAQLLAGAPQVEPPLPTQRCGQCEGVFRKLRTAPSAAASTAATTNGVARAGADRSVREGAAERPAEAHVRQVQGRLRRDLRPRGPLPDIGLQEDLDLDARRSARRVLAGKPPPKAPHRMCESCNGIYPTLQDMSGRAVARVARAPGSTSAAASWRAPCAARPGIPIPSTARAARRRSSSSKTGSAVQDG